MSHRRTIFSALLVVVILAAAAGAFQVWRQHQRATLLLTALPEAPDLSRWPEAFPREVREATAAARESKDPAEPLARLAALYFANGYAAQAKPPLASLRRLQPANAKWAHLLAETHLRLGETEAAEQAFRETVRLDPTYVPAWIRLAAIRTRNGDLEGARECYARAAAGSPHDARALYLNIEFEARYGKGGDQRPRLAQLTRAYPDFKEPHTLLAELNAAAGDRAAAATERRLASTAPRELANEDRWVDDLAPYGFDTDLLRVLAAKAARERRFEAAEVLLQKALRLAPADPKMRQEVALVYEMMNRPRDALQVLQQGLDQCPEDPPLRVQLSRMLCSQGRAEEAIELLRKSLERWPAEAPLHMALGIALSSTGGNQQAVASLREALRLDSTLVEAQYDLAACLLALGRRDEARAAAQQAVAMRPDYVNALFLIGGLALEDGDLAAADPALSRLLDLRPGEPRVHVMFAALQWRKGAEAERSAKFDEAEKLYRAGLEVQPGYPPLLRATGLLAIRQGRLADAIDAFRGCVQAEPGNAGGYLLLGKALKTAGRAAEAREVLERGLRLAQEKNAAAEVEEFKRAIED